MNEQRIGDEVRLPRPPGVIRRVLAEHPLAVDVTIVVCYGIGCLLMLAVDLLSGYAFETTDVPPYLAWPWWPVAVLRTLAVGAALLLRRRYPLAGIVVVALALLGSQGAQGIATSIALLFMIYAVPVYSGVAAGWIGYAIACSGSMLSYGLELAQATVFSGPIGPGDIVAVETGVNSGAQFAVLSIMTAVWYLAILMLGINLGNRRRYLQAIIDRAHQLARERDQRAQLAVAEERSRIAREMHDIVAHSLSVMIALSEGASRAAETAPDAAADAMQRSAETGRTALAEMRRLLGALHSPSDQAADLAPQPSVQQLPELVRGFRDAGLDASLTVVGDASGDRGQELAIYRIAQEGLTNVLRYAGMGARAEVRIERMLDRTLVEVRDYGSAPNAPRPVSGVGSGRGLAGLAERVRVLGGTIDSGPQPAERGGGWLLRAILPIDAAAQQGNDDEGGRS